MVVISVSPACGVELVEVVCSGRISVDLLVEVLLPGRSGRRGRKGQKKKRKMKLHYYIIAEPYLFGFQWLLSWLLHK